MDFPNLHHIEFRSERAHGRRQLTVLTAKPATLLQPVDWSIQDNALVSVVVQELDARCFQGTNNLLTGCDVSADRPVAALHTLDRRNVNTGALGEFSRGPAQDGSCGAQLVGRQHGSPRFASIWCNIAGK